MAALICQQMQKKLVSNSMHAQEYWVKGIHKAENFGEVVFHERVIHQVNTGEGVVHVVWIALSMEC